MIQKRTWGRKLRFSGRTTSIYTFNGPQKKQLVTGAYSQISGYTVENNPVINNRNRMQGLLPGLFVMQNNGEPGDESASLWMRGKRTFRNNEPVILVDGFERSMDLLDPNEIESITVMKDAAATAQEAIVMFLRNRLLEFFIV